MSLFNHTYGAQLGDCRPDLGTWPLSDHPNKPRIVALKSWLESWSGGMFEPIAPHVKLPSYFALMKLVELHHPEDEWQFRKALMEQCLADFSRAYGYVLLTRLDRGWYGEPRVFEEGLCGGTRAYGDNYFREPVSYFEKLNPSAAKREPQSSYIEK